MTERLHIAWNGVSGKEYRYWIYPVGTDFPKKPGNYIFAKETEPHQWLPVYISETEDLSERFEYHHKLDCIKKNGATAIHVHEGSLAEDVRRAEESDLIDNW